MYILCNHRKEAVLPKKYISDTEGERPRFCEDHGRFFSKIFLKVTRFRYLVKTLF